MSPPGFFQCYRKTPPGAIRSGHSAGCSSGVGWQIHGTRWVLNALAPDFRAAQERVGRGLRERTFRIPAPGVETFVEPAVDLGELGPAFVGPAIGQADRDEGPLGEDHVGVARRIPVALTVADEHDSPAGGLVVQHALAL